MALLVPYVGEVEMLNRILNHSTPDDVVIHLYTNNATPAPGDTVGSYTQSTGTGYAAITLTGANWTIATNAGTTSATYAQVTFTYTGPEPTVYGYYVTNNAGTVVMWAERFSDGPYAIPSGGGSVKITPKIQLQ